MRILIDTSYFLPLIKIGLENFSNNLLLELLNNHSNTYYYSNISLFELTAKGMKSSTVENIIDTTDIIKGIDALVNDNRLHIIDYIHNTLIIEIATKLRGIHSDSIDCIIFACAIQECEAIVTMDSNFVNKILKTREIVEILIDINENFSFFVNTLENSLNLEI